MEEQDLLIFGYDYNRTLNVVLADKSGYLALITLYIKLLQSVSILLQMKCQGSVTIS